MARRKRKTNGVALPWEDRGTPLRNLVAGSRSRTVLVTTGATLAVLLLVQAVRERRAERETRLAIASVEQAVAQFRGDEGRCPRSTYELVHPPHSRARYLREMPKDGWGHALYVRCPSADDPDSADVVSRGPHPDFFDEDTNP